LSVLPFFFTLALLVVPLDMISLSLAKVVNFRCAALSCPPERVLPVVDERRAARGKSEHR